MTRMRCPQCQSRDVTFYDGMLGYEAIRCNSCNQETDANHPESYCERTDRLPDLCHHSEYRIYVNGQYVESAGNLGRNAAHVLGFWQRRRRGKSVEIRALACRVPGCTWGQL
jgi:hypothetical protein